MKLNIDCIRDILLSIEELPFNQSTTVSELNQKLIQYDEDQIEYTCLRLEEGGFIHLSSLTMLGCASPRVDEIYNLTYDGHEFLEQIRPTSRWNKIKDKAQKIGCQSLKMLSDIAVQLTAETLSKLISH